MRRINPYRLWLGHAGDGRDFRGQFDLGIRCVVQLAIEEPPISAPREMISLRFPLLDGCGNDAALLRLATAAVADLIRREVPTLVCCGGGMSRSPAIAAAALSRLEGCELGKCLRRVTAEGPADVSAALWDELCLVLKGQV